MTDEQRKRLYAMATVSTAVRYARRWGISGDEILRLVHEEIDVMAEDDPCTSEPS
jgi:hypothetical protein